MILVGDAVGFQHPLTAVGMTLGMADAATSVSAGGFPTWRRMRERETRVAEMLAGALYEIFGSHSASAAAIRSEIYELWRRDAGERVRTMRYLSGDDHRLSAFSQAFIKVAAPALGRLAIRAVRSGNPKGAAPIAREMVGRIRRSDINYRRAGCEI